MSEFNSEEPKTVLIYGDSNTWGFNFDALGRFPFHERWTTRVQQSLNSSHPGKFHIIPEGLSGRTTMYDHYIEMFGECNLNGRPTLPTTLHSHTPLDLIVLALGTNDLCGRCGPPENAVSRCVAGVRQLVKDIQSLLGKVGRDGSAKILVLSLPPLVATDFNFTRTYPSNLTDIRIEANDKLQVLCQEENIPFLDISTVLTLNSTDGVHFNVEDQVQMSKIVVQAIENIFA